MSAPIPLRRDFGASHLRGLAKKTKSAPRPVGFWLLQRSMTARRAPRPFGSTPNRGLMISCLRHKP